MDTGKGVTVTANHRVRAHWPRLLLILALILPAAHDVRAQQNADEVRALIASYIERHNSHDLAGVMELYAEDAVFHLSMGRPPVAGRAAIRELERFDVAAQSTIYPQGIRVEQDAGLWRVHINGAIEHSEIFEAAGVSIVMAQGIRNAFVLRGGQIIELYQPALLPACSDTVLAAFSGLVQWLEESDDPRRHRLVANGFINLTPETIPHVILALQDWRGRTGWQPAPDRVSQCAGFTLESVQRAE